MARSRAPCERLAAAKRRCCLAADNLGLAQEFLARALQRVKPPRPSRSRDHRDDANDAGVTTWGSTVAIEYRATPQCANVASSGIYGKPRTRHVGHPNHESVAMAAPMYRVAGRKPYATSGGRGSCGVGRASRSRIAAARRIANSAGRTTTTSVTVALAECQSPATARPKTSPPADEKRSESKTGRRISVNRTASVTAVR